MTAGTVAASAQIREASLPIAIVKLASRVIIEVSEALVAMVGSERENLLGSDATRYLVGEPSAALPLLSTGKILGYEARATVRDGHGGSLEVHLWVHAFDGRRPPELALIVVDDESPGSLPGLPPAADDVVVIGTVDAEWRVERVTADVTTLLGYEPEAVVGTAFLAALHPGDVAEMLSGLAHAVRIGRSVVVRLRLRTRDGDWRWCRASVASMPDSGGLAFVLCPAVVHGEPSDDPIQLREHLRRIASEIQAMRLLPQASELPSARELPAMHRLTAREIQIVVALTKGRRSSDIARDLSLAPSTVRNHLASVYRKLDVSSQIEMLAVLRGEAPRTMPRQFDHERRTAAH